MNTFTNIYDRLKDRQKKRERVDTYTQDALLLVSSMIKINGMFDQTGLNPQLFQIIKLSDGMVGLTKYRDEYVMASCTQIGLPDRDGKPIKVNACFFYTTDNTNTGVKVEERTVGKDIVLLYNNQLLESEDDIFRFASGIADMDNSFRLNVKYSRYLPLLLARNDKEKTIFEQAIKAMDDGKQTVVEPDELTIDDITGEKRDPVLNLTDVRNADMIQYLSEQRDSLLRWFFNKYGLYTSGNAKHAQQSKMEIDNGESASWVFPLMMLKETDEFCERANALYNLSLDATLSDLHSLLWQKFLNQQNVTAAENVNDDNVSDIVTEAGTKNNGEGETEDE